MRRSWLLDDVQRPVPCMSLPETCDRPNRTRSSRTRSSRSGPRSPCRTPARASRMTCSHRSAASRGTAQLVAVAAAAAAAAAAVAVTAAASAVAASAVAASAGALLLSAAPRDRLRPRTILRDESEAEQERRRARDYGERRTGASGNNRWLLVLSCLQRGELVREGVGRARHLDVLRLQVPQLVWHMRSAA